MEYSNKAKKSLAVFFFLKKLFLFSIVSKRVFLIACTVKKIGTILIKIEKEVKTQELIENVSICILIQSKTFWQLELGAKNFYFKNYFVFKIFIFKPLQKKLLQSKNI
jgi:hypothetical protein